MPAMKLIQSVGIGGANKLDDVKAVQTALNSLLSLMAPNKLDIHPNCLQFG
ncbi:hypothetical protein I6F65_21240 [Pseudoalteromonas sp. SWXJZ94C]|uniref:hypothetical protein n=1 Tax=Pseudoalteromonas sp. SWXJZ94C TaxID=2792065 RepID=UPI0018CE6A23|nr:hypothetical protein [Pseudoalteromonas sp. SWXJZ94C]MBH0059461.1 hypothetical protein [Pseudoalteromonas sp. SWXJZ94C]